MARFIDTRNAADFQLDQLGVELSVVEGYTRLMTGIDDALGHTVLEIIFDFDEEVSPTQLADATAIIDAHVPGALNFKVLRYANTTAYNMIEVPLELDYTTGLSEPLYRSVDSYDVDHPELPSVVTYYAEADHDSETFETTYDDPVVIERYTYTADELDVVRSEVKTISWVLESGAEHDTTKTITTYY